MAWFAAMISLEGFWAYNPVRKRTTRSLYNLRVYYGERGSGRVILSGRGAGNSSPLSRMVVRIASSMAHQTEQNGLS
jgi:hypothetical protein